KVSPRLKFRWPSSEVCERPRPPLLTPMRFLFGLAVDQLAPTESDESNWPSISPMLKLTPNAGLASVEARLTAKGSFARRQNWFADVIDATPCTFFVMAVSPFQKRPRDRCSRLAPAAKRLVRLALPIPENPLTPTIASRHRRLIPLKCDLRTLPAPTPQAPACRQERSMAHICRLTRPQPLWNAGRAWTVAPRAGVTGSTGRRCYWPATG